MRNHKLTALAAVALAGTAAAVGASVALVAAAPDAAATADAAVSNRRSKTISLLVGRAVPCPPMCGAQRRRAVPLAFERASNDAAYLTAIVLCATSLQQNLLCNTRFNALAMHPAASRAGNAFLPGQSYQGPGAGAQSSSEKADHWA